MTPNKSEGNEDAKGKGGEEDDEIDIEDVLTTTSKGRGGRTTTNIKIRTRKKSRIKADEDGSSSVNNENYGVSSCITLGSGNGKLEISNDKGVSITDLESGNGKPSSIMGNDIGLTSTSNIALEPGNEQPTMIRYDFGLSSSIARDGRPSAMPNDDRLSKSGNVKPSSSSSMPNDYGLSSTVFESGNGKPSTPNDHEPFSFSIDPGTGRLMTMTSSGELDQNELPKESVKEGPRSRNSKTSDDHELLSTYPVTGRLPTNNSDLHGSELLPKQSVKIHPRSRNLKANNDDLEPFHKEPGTGSGKLLTNNGGSELLEQSVSVKIHPRSRNSKATDDHVSSRSPRIGNSTSTDVAGSEIEMKMFVTNNEDVLTHQQSNDIQPENHNVYMKTWGCSHNTSDSEYMAGLLVQNGFKIAKDKMDASVWILNSCTVKGPSEQHFKNEVEEGRRLNKKVIVSGCVPQGDSRSEYIKGLSVIGVKQIDEVATVVEETLKGNTVRLLSFTKKNGSVLNGVKRKNPPGASLHFPKIRRNELIEIIPVSTGCLNSCTYCKTKLARGNLSSYPLEEIISRASQVIKEEGVKEIWLTSEDLGAWGIDIGLTIVDLLKALVEVIPPNCMLRLGMTNPPYMFDHLEEIAEILKSPQVYGFLHIPVQAGSDSVLLEMKREYSRKQFEHIVNFLRDRVPSLTIATDIICGFPTETEEDFEETLDMVERYKFSVLYINQFYPRPGTVAASKMARLPTHIVKSRSKRLTDLFLSYSPYAHPSRVGHIYRNVLVTEISHDGKHLVGHNKAYEQILLRRDSLEESESDLMGAMVDVEIVSVSKFSMTGVLLKKKKENSAILLNVDANINRYLLVFGLSLLVVSLLMASSMIVRGGSFSL